MRSTMIQDKPSYHKQIILRVKKPETSPPFLLMRQNVRVLQSKPTQTFKLCTHVYVSEVGIHLADKLKKKRAWPLSVEKQGASSQDFLPSSVCQRLQRQHCHRETTHNNREEGNREFL